MAATLDDTRVLEATWTTDDVYEVIRTYVRFLEEHGAFMLVWSQATYGDEALAKAGTRTRLVNARRFGEFIQRVSGETVDPAEEPAVFGLAILVMIDRYWSYWRVNGFPFSEDQVVETLGDILAAFIAAWSTCTVTSTSTGLASSRGTRWSPFGGVVIAREPPGVVLLQPVAVLEPEVFDAVQRLLGQPQTDRALRGDDLREAERAAFISSSGATTSSIAPRRWNSRGPTNSPV